MKHLLVCLFALLAVPAAAQVSTSKTVTITITAPAGVCSVTPPPAAAAGFTTQALCSDWTVAMPANWMGGCSNAGNGAPVNAGDQSGHNWWLNPWFSNTYQPCIATQVTDPNLGGLVLDLSWVTDSNAYNVGAELQSTAWFSTGTPNSGISFPNNAYYEMTFRLAPITKGTWGGIFTWPVLAQTDSSKEGIENDVIEMDVGQLFLMDAAIHNWPLAGPPGQFIWQGFGANNGGIGIGVPTSFDPTVYHTFGLETTSDGVSAYQTCTFTDGVTNSCASQPIPGGWPVGAEATLRYMLMMINACDFWNGTCNPNGTLQHMYVKDVKVWSCPSWATTQCNKQPAPTVINATDFCAANGGGNGSAGSPWRWNCIQAAVDSAAPGNTVFLAAGNWQLNTAPTDPARVVINKSLNLVGAGSGNTFDVWGHVNNASGVSMCPTSSPSITCVLTKGTSYTLGNAPNDAGGILIGTITQFAVQPSCNNVNVSHINFDSEYATNGGDYEGILVVRYCAGPVTIDDIRHLGYGGTPTGGPNNPETQIFPDLSNGVVIKNSMLSEANSGVTGGNYQGNFLLEPIGGEGLGTDNIIQNTIFYQFWPAPTNNSRYTITGSAVYMFSDGTGSPSQDNYTGFTGQKVGGSASVFCPEVSSSTGQCIGSSGEVMSNNIFYSPGSGVAIGGSVNDPTTNGALSNVSITGNWVKGSIADIDACVWHIFGDQGSCAAGGQQAMAFNILVDSNCNVSNNGTPFNITNNSLLGTSSSHIDGSGTQQLTCYLGSTQSGSTTLIPTTVYGLNAQKNYLSSPSNQYITNGNTISPVQTNNFCTPAAGTVTGCATSGFSTLPTVSFSLGTLSGTTVPIVNPTFTAQYGAVQWLTSTSSTPPTSGDARWSSNNGSFPNSAPNSYLPPVSLSGVTHGSTVNMWVMDSAGHVSATASAVVQ